MRKLLNAQKMALLNFKQKTIIKTYLNKTKWFIYDMVMIPLFWIVEKTLSLFISKKQKEEYRHEVLAERQKAIDEFEKEKKKADFLKPKKRYQKA